MTLALIFIFLFANVSAAIWTAYLFGQVVHTLMKAKLSSSSKLTPWHTLAEYAATHYAELLFRFTANTALFLIWWENPQFFNGLLHRIWPAVDITSVLPLTPGTAIIYGLFCDVVLGWITAKIPALQAYIPPEP